MAQKTRILGIVALICILNLASARCSFWQKIGTCNRDSKSAFAVAFNAAYIAPAVGCFRMSPSEWKLAGCNNPASDRSYVKVCAPAKWSGVLSTFATAIALKRKILVKSPYGRHQLCNTPRGRALMRHELTHIRQQARTSAYNLGYRYITEYCRAGCSYRNNKYEVEARRYENYSC